MSGVTDVLEVWFAIGPALMFVAGWVASDQWTKRAIRKEDVRDSDQDAAELERMMRTGARQSSALSRAGKGVS